MNKKNLQNIIDKLEKEDRKEKAYFGIFEYGGGPDESFIKASKEGLELFALEILKAARDSEELLKSEKEESVFPLGFDEDWIDDDCSTYIQYVEPIDVIRTNVKQEPYMETWKDKTMKFGCISAILIAIISAIVGIVTIVKWVI
ncbi:hypothetical protein [Echinicola sp. 20G]|uniref:hypothetical protein n=1 Tax=Echinicola sp. 20G TaxID=2781961 RepID=UPI001910697F|nr:hypothetical protein [Echinicola sp. 20G]